MSCYVGMSRYEDSGFRLAGPPSECSLRSKARIDALFEDSSSALNGWYAGVSTVVDPNDAAEDDAGMDEQRRVNSAVQARIEAMFASVEAETPGESAAAILPNSLLDSFFGNWNKFLVAAEKKQGVAFPYQEFCSLGVSHLAPSLPSSGNISVRYMGAAPVGGRVASVRGLQEPLRQLLERVESSVRAELEVSKRGLCFRTSKLCEKNNPFRRIAVWSALRLRRRKTPSGDSRYAFLPLVGDSHSHQQDPNRRENATQEDKHADLYRTMRGLHLAAEEYPAIFAVVMRRAGATRVLECHAFACRSDEDAVAAAATLYRALLADLESNTAAGTGTAARRRPRQTNGLGRVSLASSVHARSLDGSKIFSDRSSCSSHRPVRPPRIKKTTIATSSSKEETTTMTTPRQVLVSGRRKKDERLESKAEDILEGRARRRESTFSEDVVLDKLSSNDKLDLYEAIDQNKNQYDRLPVKTTTSSEKENPEVNFNKVYQTSREESSTIYSSRSIVEGVPIYDRVDKLISRSEDREKSKTPRHGASLESRRLSLEEERKWKNSTRRLPPQKDQIVVEACPGKRLTRVVTMDKPLRKESSGSCSNLLRATDYSESNDNNNNDNDGTLRRQSARVRKRSRAGSEPPIGRLTEAKEILRESRLKRCQSDLEVHEDDRGDLMTRVELPRRGSFLNPGSARKPNSVTGGTPLGFTELFDEFRNQEGLTSVDDILAAIIDPEGMSFNDLKPLYKEFLLKLAATLTQDELYQRSASIMRRRKRGPPPPQRRRSSSRRSCLLGRAIKRSVSRLKAGPTEFTSVIFPARRFNDSFGSSSSCDAGTRKNHRNRGAPARLGRRKSSWRNAKNAGWPHTTSEDSDTCRRLNRSVAAIGANRSSSGYVSCSECSYDSESCTCVSADKCYCSLTRRVPAPTQPPRGTCACDTDSCSESNKCYCARRPTGPVSILEQLRQRGIVPSESTLSRGPSPDRIFRANKTTGHASTCALEAKNQPRSGGVVACSSSDNLALDYDLFSPGRRSRLSSSTGGAGSEKVLVVSARDTQGRLVYVGGGGGGVGGGGGGCVDRDNQQCLSRGNARSGAHHEALSIKKSAEIAAVFGPDSSSRISRRASNASSVRSSVSLEAGLGYLP